MALLWRVAKTASSHPATTRPMRVRAVVPFSTSSSSSSSSSSSWWNPSTAKVNPHGGTTQSHRIESRLLEDVHPLHLFRIVQDVDRYGDFLPLCHHSEVFPSTIRDGGRFFKAELVIGFGMGGTSSSSSSSESVTPWWFGPSSRSSSSWLKTRYVSEVTVDPEALTIETKSEGGSIGSVDDENGDEGETSRPPFEALSSRWKLRPAPNDTTSGTNTIGTMVDFEVSMTVKDPFVAAILHSVLEGVAETQVAAFTERCQVVPIPSPEELAVAESFEPLGGRSSNRGSEAP